MQSYYDAVAAYRHKPAHIHHSPDRTRFRQIEYRFFQFLSVFPNLAGEPDTAVPPLVPFERQWLYGKDEARLGNPWVRRRPYLDPVSHLTGAARHFLNIYGYTPFVGIELVG